jgi:hypothetical protein
VLGWTAVVLFGGAVLYGVVDLLTSPFAESRLLGGQHPELIIGREWDPKHGRILTIRDDLPSKCNCPLHQMLAGREVVRIGWSRFVSNREGSMEKGDLKQNKFQGYDPARERFAMLTRRSDETIELHLFEQWSPLWTLRRLQDSLAGLLRYLSR